MEIIQTRTDIGLVRKKNEDVVSYVNHPRNKSIKLLIAADGMGGRDLGDVAASYVTSSLNRWFYNKDIKTLNDTEKTEQLIKRYIKSLNTNLLKKYGEDKLGTTLTLALINKKKTLIINVGDSRTYIYKQRKLIQITEDDSDVWLYHKYGGVKKDHLRYFSNNNIISACIGICNELCTMTSYIIDNDYDIILLLTDGVTDNITDSKIKKIIEKNKKENILTKIIEEAVYKDQHLHVPFSLTHKYTANFVVPFCGRDNASGVIYIKSE